MLKRKWIVYWLHSIFDRAGAFLTVTITPDGEVRLMEPKLSIGESTTTVYPSIQNVPIALQDRIATLRLLKIGESNKYGARTDDNDFWIFNHEENKYDNSQRD